VLDANSYLETADLLLFFRLQTCGKNCVEKNIGGVTNEAPNKSGQMNF
jgi:hypothetical protein